MSEIKNKEIDLAKLIDVVMSLYNLIAYSDNGLKTSGSLWQYYRDEPFIYNGAIIDGLDDPDSGATSNTYFWFSIFFMIALLSSLVIKGA